jgi:hypothetical protein
MSSTTLREVGYRWHKPTWERSGDRSWVLIVPSTMLKEPEFGRQSDPQFDPSQRMYELYEFDGTWVDQLHEQQIERVLGSAAWRTELR